MKSGILTVQEVLGIPRSFRNARNLFNVSILKVFVMILLSFLLGRATSYSYLSSGFAFYAAVAGMGYNKILLAIPLLLGMLTNAKLEDVYLTFSSIFIFSAFSIALKSREIKFKNSIIGFLSILVPGITTIYLQGFLFYDVFKILLNAFLVAIIIYFFENVASIFTKNKRKYILSNEEIIGAAILIQMSIIGFNNFNIFGLNLGSVLTLISIILFSYRYGVGVGALVGVLSGLIVNISYHEATALIGLYGSCGILTGVMRKHGRIGMALGIISGSLLVIILLNQDLDKYLNDILASVGIFILMPRTLMKFADNVFNKELAICDVGSFSYGNRIKEITTTKLSKFSTAFKELSKTFSQISQSKIITDKKDISLLFDKVADKVCKNCGLSFYCWDMNFYNTYQVMFKVTEQLELKGYISEEDIPEYFSNKCKNIIEFINAVNNIYEIFKIDTVWKSKIGESRKVVSQQMEGLSKVISNLASEIKLDISFNESLEDTVFSELKRNHIDVKDIVVMESKTGKYEVIVEHRGCGGERMCLGAIESIVSDALGRKMTKENRECTKAYKNEFCKIKYTEEKLFSINTGIAKASKNENSVSGDSHSFIETEDGKYILALSDGMGSGQRAATQSEAAINMIENFLEAGFDKKSSIDIINSILVLKPEEDTFTTIDLSIIDLYEGEVEFIKVGAAPSFLKRGEKVEMIRSISLPAGILVNIEILPIVKEIRNGDFIIVMSDGVADSFKKESSSYGGLTDFLNKVETRNPQDMANRILIEAFENCNNKPLDDMTVLAARIWRKN